MGAIAVTAETLSIGGPVDTFGFDPKEDRSTRSSTASGKSPLLQNIFRAPASSSPIIESETDETGCSTSQERKPLPMGISLNINVNLPVYNKTPTYKPLPQLTRRQRSFFESAKAASLLSDHPQFHLGCVIVDGSRIISSGCNSITRCSPIQQKLDHNRFGGEHRGVFHAETAALLPLIRQRADLASCTAYLYRSHKDGSLALSRPCSGCMSLLRAAGIRRVFFTVEGGYAVEDI